MKYFLAFIFMTFLFKKGEAQIIWQNLESSSSAIAINVGKSIKFNSAGVLKISTYENTIGINDSIILNYNKDLGKISIIFKNEEVFGATIINDQFSLSFNGNIKEFRFRIEHPNCPNVSIIENTSLYYDALLIKNHKECTELINGIIKKYNIKSSNDYFSNSDWGGLRDSGGSGSNSLASTLTGLDVTKFADAYANFLVSRVKQELAISFFNGFSESIRSDKVRDLQVLFKNT